MSGSERDDDFYVGYQARMPRRIARFVLPVVAALLILAAALGLYSPALHNAYDYARSDFRDIREFEGTLVALPVPHLLVVRPGETGAAAFSRYLLVGRGKSGPRIDVAALDRLQVRVKGSLIYRDGQTMISVRSADAVVDAASGEPAYTPREELGTYTLRGEVIDSKCYFGTMRPGNTKVHRGCAVRCIAGGVPAMFLVVDEDGNRLPLLLADAEGRAVFDAVLDRVAEPLEITGEVVRLDDMLILQADPDSYRRL